MMSVPQFYLVAGEDAIALDDDGIAFGAPVNADGTVDWEDSYDFDPTEEDVDYIAHAVNLLNQMAELYHEHNVYSHTPEAIFVK